MSIEGPAMAAIIARLARPEINLAAYGGLVFPIAVLIEAPIMMILAASTALSRDWLCYAKLRKFTHGLGAGLTAIHVILVATPAYYFVARGLVHAPEEIIGPARLGLLIVIPWTWSIAYRRFGQGVLIRLRRSIWVGTGTVLRLAAEVAVLAVGYAIGSLAGIAVAALAMNAGVMSEALFVFIVLRKPLKTELKPAPILQRPFTTRELVRFYVPLALTSTIAQICAPIGSAAISRMPRALDSLAAWPVVSAMRLLTSSPGLAYNETVVALVERPRSSQRLWRFSLTLSAFTTAGLVVLITPPVANLVFKSLLHLPPAVALLSHRSLWFLLPMPTIAVLQSWYQGVILHSGRTRGIIESVLLFTVVIASFLGAGVIWGIFTGIYVAAGTFTLGDVVRTVWLRIRSRSARRSLAARDSEAIEALDSAAAS
jgi:hypothetical protein